MNSKVFKGNVLPVLVAIGVMLLIVFTIPMALTPARVLGGYTSGGGATVSTADYIYAGSAAPFPVSITGSAGFNVNNMDLSSLTLAGAPITGSSISGNVLNLTFNPQKMNLPQGTNQITLSGKMKDGTPFTITITINVR